MKTLTGIFLFLLLSFISCNTDTSSSETTDTKDSVPTNTIPTGKPEQSLKDINYTIRVHKTDSLQFHLHTDKLKKERKEVIKDINVVKKLLKGIVAFSENDESENPAVEKINFRNGKVKNVKDFDDAYFVAYYPGEDILLCEGGHTTDVSYNLKNGDETEETGNPELIITSPGNTFRINGHYNGQECYSYFIQEKVNRTFEKIIQLDEEFERITKIWLCTIGDTFWIDDKTIFLTLESEADKGLFKQYFKIEIVKE